MIVHIIAANPRTTLRGIKYSVIFERVDYNFKTKAI